VSLAVVSVGAIVVAVILHEISHDMVALWFGDDTAKKAGRLTLNPIPHIDPFGSIILPILGALSGFAFIAFAKPVPVNPSRLRNPRRDMLFVSLAGPATNLLLMFGAAIVARALAGSARGIDNFNDLPAGFKLAFVFAIVNLFLALFNLLPIPPLDGSAILERFLPREWLPTWYRIRPYGFLVLFLLVFSLGFPGRAFEPFLDRLRDFIRG
jgi:Zn-dependent protease